LFREEQKENSVHLFDEKNLEKDKGTLGLKLVDNEVLLAN